jgi:type II secretory ATPase GspE/PulE/Tfp pilus assembly ATPase PilB-like protein
VIRLVNSIIGRVIDLRASDIHLEPLTMACTCATASTA